MERRNERLVPFKAIHPGFTLGKELDAREIKQKDFAKMIGMQPTHLNAVIKGNRDITLELAMKLEEALGIDYGFWMKLQASYHYNVKAIAKRNEEEQKAILEEQTMSVMVNTTILYKRLGISCLKPMERLSQVRTRMGNAYTESAIDSHENGFFKHSEKCNIDERNMRTWIILALMAARDVEVDVEYKEGNAGKAAVEIARMANTGSLTKQAIQECLNGYGIGYCFVEKLDKAPVDAFSTKKYGHPAIVVTYRYDDRDKLAFDVLHELCHLEKHAGDGCDDFIAYEGLYTDDPYEVEANEFARDMLISPSDWKAIMKVQPKSSYPSVVAKCIAEEAEKRGISKSIAISRYKHDSHVYNIKSYRSAKIQ